MEKYYVSGCRDDGEATVTCEDSEATFWTLYARDDKGLSQGIIDLAFREDAETALAVYVERDALQEQVQKLAAETILLKKFCKNAAFDADYESSLGIERGGFTDGLNDIKTPATDAIIREIGAKAVDAFGSELRGMAEAAMENGFPLSSDCLYSEAKRAERFAAKLRAGEQP